MTHNIQISVANSKELLSAEKDTLKNTAKEILASVVLNEYTSNHLLQVHCDTTIALALLYCMPKNVLVELVLMADRIKAVKHLDTKLPSFNIQPSKDFNPDFVIGNLVRWQNELSTAGSTIFLPNSKKTVDEERIEFSRSANTFAELRQAFKLVETAYGILINSRIYTDNPKFFAFLNTAMNNPKFHDTVAEEYVEKAINKCKSLLEQDYMKPTLIQIANIKNYFDLVAKYKRTSFAKDAESALDSLFEPISSGANSVTEDTTTKPMNLSQRIAAKKAGLL